jgi:OOP family OmpA-OmpF porin
MSCNAWRWIWGIIPVGILWWVLVSGETVRLQDDLRARSQQALAERSIHWVSPAFTGRSGVIRGIAGDLSTQREAALVVGQVWGVRSIVDDTELLRRQAPRNTWSARLDDNAVILEGLAVSEDDRRAINAEARRAFSGRTIVDKMRVVPNVPADSPLSAGARFGLRQLSGLSRGRVEIDDGRYTISGEARGVSEFDAIERAFDADLPRGLELKANTVTAAPVTPYTWSVRRKESQVQLSGHVPAEAERDAIYQLARQTFQQDSVIDRLVVARGQPENWRGIAQFAIIQVGKLTEGAAELVDQRLTISGIADSEETIADIRRALRQGLPGGFRSSETLRIDPEVLAARAEAERQARVAAEAAERREAERRREIASATRPDTAQAERERERAAGERPQRSAPSDIDLELERARAEALRLREAEQARVREAEAQRVREAEAEARRIREAEAKAKEEVERRARAEAEAREARVRAAIDKARSAARSRAESGRPDGGSASSAGVSVRPSSPEANRCQAALNSSVKEGRINFGWASADLERRSLRTLDTLVEVVKGCDDLRIDIVGHTDAEGTEARNQNLSERRARAVADYLVKSGIDANKIEAFGLGESEPMVPNDTAQNRAKNRRIEFMVRGE